MIGVLVPKGGGLCDMIGFSSEQQCASGKSFEPPRGIAG
jgi:hypothetical protein